MASPSITTHWDVHDLPTADLHRLLNILMGPTVSDDHPTATLMGPS